MNLTLREWRFCRLYLMVRSSKCFFDDQGRFMVKQRLRHNIQSWKKNDSKTNNTHQSIRGFWLQFSISAHIFENWKQTPVFW